MKHIPLIVIALCILAPATPTYAARLYTNGFELQSLTQGEDFSSGGTGTNVAIETSPVQSGSSSIGIAPAVGLRWFGHIFSSSLVSSDIYVRTYIYVNAAPTVGEPEIISMYDSASVSRKVHVVLTSSMTLELHSPSGSLIGSASGVLNTGQWYYVELNVDHANTSAEARVDGVSFASTTSVSLSDDYDAVYFGSPAFAATFDINWDDVAINDSTGSYQNSFAGAGKIVYMRPNAAGDSAATSNLYTEIDEINPNDATDFVNVNDATTVAEYNASSTAEYGIGSSDTITLVHVGIRIREESSGASIYEMRIKSASGGTVATTTGADIGTATWRTDPVGGNNFMLNRLVSYTDPTTGIAWTPTGTNSLDNMQIGMRNYNTLDLDVSALWARVEYIPYVPPAPSAGGDQGIIFFDE